MPTKFEIRHASTRSEIDDVRALMRSFVEWHRTRHEADLDLINRYFGAGDFERELAELPGKYAPPRGRLLVAYAGETPAGCVALRDLGEGVCEMKRMFVNDAARGTGVGKQLAERVLSEARDAGYRAMRLDTSHRQREAIGLYERLGFTRIAPYYEVPAEVGDWLVFYERPL